jgi:hypothetical protein
MNQRLKKLISIFLLVLFLLGSGAGQLVHAAFHNDFSKGFSRSQTTINLPHSYCTALQLMLPEFSGSAVIDVPAKIIIALSSFPHIKISIPQFSSFKTSDRAPPVTMIF